MLTNFAMLLRSPAYLGFVLCAAFAYGGLFSWISNATFVIISRFGVPPAQFGFFFGTVVVGYGTGAFLGGQFGGRLGIVRTVGLGLGINACAGLVLATTGWSGLGGLPLIVLAMAAYFFGCSLVIAQSVAGALGPFPRIAGTAAALLGCLQMLTGMLVNSLSSLFFDGSERPMVTITATCALGGLGAFAFMRRAQQARSTP